MSKYTDMNDAAASGSTIRNNLGFLESAEGHRFQAAAARDRATQWVAANEPSMAWACRSLAAHYVRMADEILSNDKNH